MCFTVLIPKGKSPFHKDKARILLNYKLTLPLRHWTHFQGLAGKKSSHYLGKITDADHHGETQLLLYSEVRKKYSYRASNVCGHLLGLICIILMAGGQK
jgi:hypothetical protein